MKISEMVECIDDLIKVAPEYQNLLHAIRDLIEQYAKGDEKCRILHTPKVSREFVDTYTFKLSRPSKTCLKEQIIQMLVEAGVEVEE